MPELIKQTYRCTNRSCNATQDLYFWPGEMLTACTVCVHCGNGREITLQEMINNRRGMFPVIEQERKPFEFRTNNREAAQRP